MPNTHSKADFTGVPPTLGDYFDKRVRNYWPKDAHYILIVDGEYGISKKLEEVAYVFGFTSATLPVVFIKEFFLKEMSNEPIRALYWTARIVNTQTRIQSEKEQRSFQKTVGFAALYGGSVKIPRV